MSFKWKEGTRDVEMPGSLADDILTALVTQPELAAIISKYGITEKNFNLKTSKQIFAVASAFHQKWQRPIGIFELRNEFDKYRGDDYALLHHIINTIEAIAPNVTADRDILEDKLRHFVNKHRLSRLLTKSFDLNEANEFEKAFGYIKAEMREIEREFYQPKDLPNMTELLQEQFPPVPYLVNELIPQGLTIIAGPPKIGKSWLALDIAMAVASGGLALGEQTMVTAGKVEPARQHGVLYLGLEDSNRRLHNRAHAMLGDNEQRANKLAGLRYEFEVPTLDNGLIGHLDRILERCPDIDLIIIDTLQYVRGRKTKNDDPYGSDVRAVSILRQLINDHPNLSIVVVHHTRKAKGDIIESVLGTQGISGSFDTIVHLESAADGQDKKLARLQIKGRDLIDIHDKLIELGDPPRWQVLNDNFFEANTAEKRETINDLIVDIIRKNGGPLDTASIARELEAIKKTDVKRSTIDATLHRLSHGHNAPIVSIMRGMWDLRVREPVPNQDDQPEKPHGFFH